jgi:hypothetical protein
MHHIPPAFTVEPVLLACAMAALADTSVVLCLLLLLLLQCQEADLKYMIAFESPHRAVQWCLAVQVRAALCMHRRCIRQHLCSCCYCST